MNADRVSYQRRNRALSGPPQGVGCRSGLGRLMPGLTLIVTLMATLLPYAADPLSAQEETLSVRSAVREVPVPVSELQERLPEAWRAVSSEELERLLKGAQADIAEPLQAQIVQAVYRGTIEDDVCRDCQFEAEIVRTGERPTVLRFEPVNLALANLTWRDGDAFWGSSAAGHVSVLVDRKLDTLSGNWTARGQRRSHRVEFDLQIPQATVSQLHLRVPAQLQLTATPGIVTEHALPDTADWREWRIELGRATACRVTVSERRRRTQPNPVLLVRPTTTYAVRDEGLRVQADFQVDVRNGPVEYLDVHVPHELQVYSVTYGAETPLAWRELSPEELSSEELPDVVPLGSSEAVSAPPPPAGSWLRVQLPDPLQGPLRRLRVAAVGPVQIKEPWNLPQLSLPDGVFLGGEVHLDVTRPLETRSLNVQGCFQTHAVMDAASHESMTFQQFLRQGRIRVTLGYPETEVSGTVVTDVDLHNNDWHGTAQVAWRAQGGSQFVVRCRVAPGWKVADVTSHPSFVPVDIVYWDLRPLEDESSLLTIEFASALTSDRAHTVLISLQRIVGRAARQLRLPLLEPVGCQDLETAIAVNGLAEIDNLSAADLGGFRRTTIEMLPPFARDSVALADLHDQVQDVLFLRSAAPTTQQPIEIATGAATLSARAEVNVVVEPESVREEFDLRIRPYGETVEHLHVYFATSGTGIAWVLDDETAPLMSRRWPINQHRAFGLPKLGELWEIELPRPLTGPFTLRGTRVQGFNLTVSAALPFVPLTQVFEGRVSAFAGDELPSPVDFATRELTDSLNALGSETAEHAKRWEYSAATATLQVRRERLSTAPAVATMELRSQIFIDDNAQDVHWCRYRVKPGGRRREFQFRLSSTAELIEARVNGISVRPVQQNERFTLGGLDPDEENLIEIRYWTPSDGSQIVSRRQFALPQTDCTTIDFDWQFALPRHVVAIDSPSRLQLLTPAPPVSWTRRLFGPLGRSSQSNPFDPFNPSSWKTALLPDEERLGNPDVENWEFGSMGWSVWEAAADRQPDRIRLEIVNRSQVYVCAWITLLSTVVVGFCLRLLRLRGRTVVGTFWLAISLLAAWALPPTYAEVAGGAISGWIIACLVPRQLLFRLRAPARQERSTQLLTPSKYARGASVAGLCVWAIVQGHAAWGQAADQLETLTPQDVIVPMGDSRPLPIRYVHEELLQDLRSRERARRGEEYFISGAHYECDVRGITTTLHAKLRLAVFSARDAVDVYLPFDGANLGGDAACRVNGSPHPILPARSRPGFILQLTRRRDAKSLEPKVLTPTRSDRDDAQSSLSHPAKVDYHVPYRPIEIFDVELDLYPPTESVPGGGRIDVQIPRVPDSHVHAVFDRDYAAVEIPGIPEMVVEPIGEADELASGRHTVTLGMRDRLQVRWSTQRNGQQDEPGILAESEAIVVATPTALKYHYQLICEPAQGTVDALNLHFPPGLEQLEVNSPEVGAVTLQSQPGASSVLLEFREPLSELTVLRLSFLIPQQSDRLTFKLPAADPFSGDARVRQVQNAIGVVAAPAFTLNGMETDNNLVSRVANGLAFDNLRADQAFQLQAPTELTFRLVPKSPRRQVFQNLEGVIDADRIQWRLSAEIKTETTPAFSHELELDPRLTIESISIREDGAERLVRWTLEGRRLTLFLSGRTTGLQNLELNASQPHSLEESVSLPEIRFEDAELVESQLSLWHRSALHVELVGPADLEPEDAPPPTDATPGEDWLGRWDILPFRAPELQLRIRDERSRLGFDALIVLQPNRGRTWTLTAHLRPYADGSRTLKISIPDALTESIDADGVGVRLEPVAAEDGSRSIRVDLEDPPPVAPSVSLSTQVEIPYDLEWTVPQFQMQGLAADQVFVLIGSEPEAPVTGPAENRVAPPLPDWVDDAVSHEDAGEDWDAYRFTTSDIALYRQPLDRQMATGTDVALVETALWVRGMRRISGRTTIYPLVLRDAPDLVLDWPESLWLRAVTVNGEPLNVTPQDGQLELTLRRLEQPVHLVQLFWEEELDFEGILFRKVIFEVPSLAGEAEHRSLLRVVPSGSFECRLRSGVRPLSEGKLLLLRIESLLELCRQQVRYGVSDKTSWRILSAAVEAAGRSLDDAEQSSDSDWDLQELQRQLNQLRAEMQELAEFFERLPDGEDNVTALVPLADSPGSLSAAFLHTTATDVCEAWIIEFPRFKLVVGLLALPLALIVIGRVVRKKTGAWLNSHQAISWLLFGVVWWSCLTPSILGIVFVMVGIVYLFRRPVEASYSSSLIIE